MYLFIHLFTYLLFIYLFIYLLNIVIQQYIFIFAINFYSNLLPFYVHYCVYQKRTHLWLQSDKLFNCKTFDFIFHFSIINLLESSKNFDLVV